MLTLLTTMSTVRYYRVATVDKLINTKHIFCNKENQNSQNVTLTCQFVVGSETESNASSGLIRILSTQGATSK